MGHLRRISLYIIFSFLFNIRLSLEKPMQDDENVIPIYRLPENLVPTSYDLSLTINPDETTFTGTATINFDVVDESDTINEIYIHVDREYIAILSAVLNDDTVCTVGAANEVSILSLSCVTGAKASNNSLSIDYLAKFSEDGYGLIKSGYVDGGKQQTLIESNFKPIYARRVFPCFDEPDLIATFSIEITHPEDYNVISNSLVLEDDGDTGSNLKTTKFATTPQISTYLVSILISKLEAVYTNSSDEYEFKVFTRQDVADLTDTVVNNYYKILDNFKDYLGVPYQDVGDTECYQVAIPDNLESVADFGLFTYRETDLLDDGDHTTNRVTQDILTNIAYKLVHEWYGGEVATEWWSDVWANEALATYLKYVIVDKVDSKLDLPQQFVIEVVQKALQYDAYPYVQPLSSSESDININSEIADKLDPLSYYKGASILHMIKGIFESEETFQSALKYHWDQRKHSASSGSALLKNLASVYDKEDLYSYLQTWIESPGYPLLTVKLKDYTEDNVEVSILSQKRFIYPTQDDMSKYTNIEWTIPLDTANLGVKDFNVRADVFLTPDDEMMYFAGNTDWLLFNVQMGFYYRVNYEEPLWRRFIISLKNNTERNVMPELCRAQLVDDIFNIARIGDVSYYTVFDLTDYLSFESSYYAWYAAFNGFSYLIGKMGGPVAEENLKIYIWNLMDHLFLDRLFEEETNTNMLKLVMAFEMASKLNHSGVVNYTLTEYNNYKTNGVFTDYSIRGVVLCNAVRYSTNANEEWQFLWDLYGTTSSVQEQKDILKALGCSADKDLLKSYLSKIIATTDSPIKKDALLIFKSISSTSVGVTAAMEFLEANITEVASLGINTVSEILYILAEQLMSDDELKWLTNFLDNEIFDDYSYVKTKATTLATVNNYWQDNYLVEVKEIFLTLRTTTSTTTSPSTSTGSTETETTTEQSTSDFTTDFSTLTTEGKGEIIHPLNSIIVIFVTFSVFRMI